MGGLAPTERAELDGKRRAEPEGVHIPVEMGLSERDELELRMQVWRGR